MLKDKKISLEGFFKPTPSLFIKIGNGLMGAALFAGGFAFLGDNLTIAYIFVFIGAIGKFITMFFTDTQPTCQHAAVDYDYHQGAKNLIRYEEPTPMEDPVETTAAYHADCEPITPKAPKKRKRSRKPNTKATKGN
jgi:hypothetical protein